MNFRFPFFGARPTDWHTDVHPYRIVFAKRPEDSERLALAATLARFAARHPEMPLGPWTWNGRHARFSFEPVTGDDSDSFFISVEELMTSLHRSARIAEVIHESARGGSSEWDEWTEAKGKPPTAAPAGAWATDAAFEAERAAQRDGAEAAARAAETEATEARERSAAVAQITCVPAPDREPPVIVPPPALAALFEAAGPPTSYLHAGETWIGFRPKGILYLDGNGKVKKRAFKKVCGETEIAISPSGATVSVVGSQTSTISLPSATVVAFEKVKWTNRVAYVDEDRIACHDNVARQIVLRTLDGRDLDFQPVKFASRMLALSGKRVLVESMDPGADGYIVQVYALRDDKLVLVGAGEGTHCQQLWESDGRVFALTITKRVIELLGL